ncbi:MAG: hypothetical protein WBP56_16960 [Polyangia bacterium]|jgi:hypothetical protein
MTPNSRIALPDTRYYSSTYLRIMTFQPNGTINVSGYSLYLNQYLTDPANLFALSL